MRVPLHELGAGRQRQELAGLGADLRHVFFVLNVHAFRAFAFLPLDNAHLCGAHARIDDGGIFHAVQVAHAKQRRGEPGKAALLAHHVFFEVVQDFFGGHLDECFSAVPIIRLGFVRGREVVRRRAAVLVEMNSVANEAAAQWAIILHVHRAALRVQGLKREAPRPRVFTPHQAHHVFAVFGGADHRRFCDGAQRALALHVAVLGL
ncbi:hypothetical protein D3C72_1407270 [compost metagenome]